MRVNLMRARRMMARVRRVAEFSLDATQGLMLLTRASHPIAWVAAAMHIYKVIERHRPDKPAIWSEYGTDVCEIIVDTLFRHSAGDWVGEDNRGDPVRSFGRVTASYDGDNHGGPWGDPDDRTPFDWIWQNVGQHLGLREKANDVELDRDRDRTTMIPSQAVVRMGQDAAAMRNRGHRVGILLNGPPGSGKTAALWSIAETLGGRTLRVSRIGQGRKSQPSFVANLCAALQPDCLILDDIDRIGDRNSSALLEAVEVIMENGTAVLASCNHRTALADALLRSGRIDDKYYIGPIEPEILGRYADRLTGEEAERLRHHTVATVVRYLEKRDAVGVDRAESFLAGEEAVPATETEWEQRARPAIVADGFSPDDCDD